MDKSHLRQSAISALKKCGDTDKIRIEKKLMDHLIQTSVWKNAHTIGITVSGGFEWDTYNIIEKAWQQGKAVCVPKCYPKERKMIFYRFQSFGELEVVYYNLKEPKPIEANKVKKNDLDLIVVPGLLFDSSGYRIGFGGGYYDRFLTDYRGQTVALTSSQLLIDSIPKESHDMAVSHIITEKGIIHVEEGN